jgi:hypothetical protein
MQKCILDHALNVNGCNAIGEIHGSDRTKLMLLTCTNIKIVSEKTQLAHRASLSEKVESKRCVAGKNQIIRTAN